MQPLQLKLDKIASKSRSEKARRRYAWKLGTHTAIIIMMNLPSFFQIERSFLVIRTQYNTHFQLNTGSWVMSTCACALTTRICWRSTRK